MLGLRTQCPHKQGNSAKFKYAYHHQYDDHEKQWHTFATEAHLLTARVPPCQLGDHEKQTGLGHDPD